MSYCTCSEGLCVCILQEVSTFGFRGEALSSLCALATVTVTTRTANTSPAQRLTYDHTGTLVATAPTARAVGTTVAVKDLFKTLPVRHKVQTGAINSWLYANYFPVLSLRWVSEPPICTTSHGTIILRTQIGAASMQTSHQCASGCTVCNPLPPYICYTLSYGHHLNCSLSAKPCGYPGLAQPCMMHSQWYKALLWVPCRNS